MNRRIFLSAFCSLGLLFLVGAPALGQTVNQTSAETAKFGVYPIAYRELISRWLDEQLIDPASAQIEFIEEPKTVEVKARNGETFAGYVVDFKVNSRNKFGMYTGKQARRVYIRDGQIISGGRTPK
ncbi:MAG: hypothetical protein ABI992_06125 [Chthoniobacterales bacterium]